MLITVKQSDCNDNPTFRNKPNYNNNPDYDPEEKQLEMLQFDIYNLKTLHLKNSTGTHVRKKCDIVTLSIKFSEQFFLDKNFIPCSRSSKRGK